MSSPRAFVSFDADHDSAEKILFTGQLKNSHTPFEAQDWSSKEVLPQKQWESLIESKIKKCDFLIVLVGKQTFRASGVIKEIKMARDQKIPFFGIYVGGAHSQTLLPDGLARGRVINWDWDSISSAIDQVLEERN